MVSALLLTIQGPDAAFIQFKTVRDMTCALVFSKNKHCVKLFVAKRFDPTDQKTPQSIMAMENPPFIHDFAMTTEMFLTLPGKGQPP